VGLLNRCDVSIWGRAGSPSLVHVVVWYVVSFIDEVVSMITDVVGREIFLNIYHQW